MPSYKLPREISPTNTIASIPKSLYSEEENFDTEYERRVVMELSSLNNVRWWHRNIARAEFFTDEDRRAMRIRIPIHPAFLEADDEVLLPNSYEKATKKLSKKKIEQYEKILKLLNDGEWHKTAEIADNLGLKDTRTKELLKELIVLDKLIDNGKTKGKLYRLK